MVNEKRFVSRGRKFDQVLEGARRVFMRDGYAAANVDDIAREASVSKATLYSYFSDKKQMFDAVFRDHLDREQVDGHELAGMDLPMDQLLRFVGHLVATRAVSENDARMLRLAVAEAERFPALAAQYYATGPASLYRALEEMLKRWQDQGMLRRDIPDLRLAAESFVTLSMMRLRERVKLANAASIDEGMIRRTVDNAVAMFLSHYGTEAARRLISDDVKI